MALGAIRAGKAFVEVYADGTRLASDFKKIGNQFKAFGAGISAIGLKIMGVGTAITAPFAAAIKHFMDAGDQLDKMAARTGVSTNALSELGFAAEQSGASISEIEKSIRKMQRTIMDAASGEKTYVDALKAANVAYKDLQGQSPESQFEKIADGINNIADPTAKAAAAMEIFGRSGTMLLPMLGSVHALREEARELGLSIGPEQAKQAAVMTDAWNRLKRSTMAVFFNIGSAVADSGFLDAVTNSIKFVSRWVKANGDILRTVAKVGAGLVAGGAAVFAFGKAIQFVGWAIDGVFSAFTLAKGAVAIFSTAIAILTNPIGLLAVGLAAAAIYLIDWKKTFGGFFSDVASGFNSLVEHATAAWGAIANALMAGDIQAAWNVVQSALKLGWIQIKTLFLEGFAELKNAWATLLAYLEKGLISFLARPEIEWIAKFLAVGYADVTGNSAADAFKAVSQDFAKRRNALPQAFADIDAETAAKKSGYQGELNKAKAELERAKAAAAEAIATANGLQPGGFSSSPYRSTFIGDEIRKSLTTGTFSGQELAGTGGISVQQKILEESRKQTKQQKKEADLIAKIEQNLRDFKLELAK